MNGDRWWYDAWFVAIVGGVASSMIAAVLIAGATSVRPPHKMPDIKELFQRMFWFAVVQALLVFVLFGLASHIPFPVKATLFAFAEVGLLAAAFFDIDVFDWLNH